MRMNYHQDKKKSQISLLLALLIIVPLYFFRVDVVNFFGRVGFGAARFVWSARDFTASVGSNISFFLKTKNSLGLENNKLKIENQELKDRLFFLDILEEDNKNLRSLFYSDFGSALNDLFKNDILANILAGPNISPYDSLILDTGSNEGINEGNLVFSRSDVVLGKVVKTYLRNSKVALFSSYGTETNAYMPKSKINVVLIGQGSGNFKVEVPRDLNIELNDLALISDKGKSYPFAKLSYIEESPTDKFKKIFFISPSNIRSLKVVVIKRP